MSSLRTPTSQLVLCTMVILAGCQTARRDRQVEPELPVPARPRAEVIESGRTSDLDLTVGTDWQVDFSTTVESYLELVVERRNLDAHIQVLDLELQAPAAVSGPGGVGVQERMALRLPPGPYGLVVSPRPLGPSKGRARLRIEAFRPFQAEDVERMRLILLGQEATELDAGSSRKGYQRASLLSSDELAGWRRLSDRKAVIRTLIRLVSLERALGQLDSSIRHGEEAVALSLEANLAAEEAASRYWLAQSLNRAGLLTRASTEFRLGLVAAERAADLILQGRLLIWQGRMSEDRGDLEEARDLYQLGLDRRLEAHDTLGINSAMNNLAGIAQRMGDFPLALKLFKEAIQEARRLEDPGAQLLLNSNLAGLLVTRGQWQEALDSLTSGLEFARANDDSRNESILGRRLANLLVTLGEPELARRLLKRSLELGRASHNGPVQGGALITLAHLELQYGTLEEAEMWMLQAYDLGTRLDLRGLRNGAARGLATIKRARRQPGLALEILTPLVDEARLSKQPVRLARVFQGLAEAYLALGNPEEALRHVELTKKSLTGLAVPELRFDISFLLARIEHAQGNLSAAVAEIDRALGMVESLRLSVDDPDLRATFLSGSRQAYDFAVSRLLELDRVLPGQGFDRQAFATLERARARSLVELLATARFGAEGELDPELLEAERSALAAVADSRRRLDNAASKGPGADLDRLQAEVNSASEMLGKAENALRLAEPRYASLRYADNYAVEELQALLEPGVALIEYSLQPGKSVAFVVTREHFEVVELAAGELIQSHATALRETLTSPNRRAYEKLMRRARDLGDLVVLPLADAIDGAHRLILVPDGALAFIPFEALRLRPEGAAEDAYVIEKWAIAYSPSAGVLGSLKREEELAPSGFGLVAFADPEPPATLAGNDLGASEWSRLPGSRSEVRAIAARIGEPERAIHTDSRASEHALKSSKAVAGARWIHLASHARIDQRKPADSAIVLAAGEGEDGYLTVQEIFALNLQADLVVLSGCETALGRQIRGEGLIGLTRAFLYAGARGIQVSLWKVADDATPPLMASFYEHLNEDLGTAEALRAAKLASLDDPRRSHPFYWAPFVFIGD